MTDRIINVPTPNADGYIECTPRAYCGLAAVFVAAVHPCLVPSCLLEFVNAMGKIVYPDCPYPLIYDRISFNREHEHIAHLDLMRKLDADFDCGAPYFCYDPRFDRFYSAVCISQLHVMDEGLCYSSMINKLEVLRADDHEADFTKLYTGTKGMFMLMLAYAREYFDIRPSSDAEVCAYVDRLVGTNSDFFDKLY